MSTPIRTPAASRGTLIDDPSGGVNWSQMYGRSSAAAEFTLVQRLAAVQPLVRCPHCISKPRSKPWVSPAA